MAKQVYDLVVIGGGAAGFFTALNAAELKPGLRVVILEKTNKLLSKVKISGGGRCNVTHHEFSPAGLASHYPRGQRQLKSMFHHFQAEHTALWFQRRGVSLKVEHDGRMFPTTDDSQTIIDCFLHEAATRKIEIITQAEVMEVTGSEDHFIVSTRNMHISSRCVAVAIGGNAKSEAYAWLEKLGLSLAPPVPSLFTFNDASKSFASLMGVSVPEATVKIAGTRFIQQGPVLITHWGLSGPAVIKLSAWAAEHLHNAHYQFTALINWLGAPAEEVRAELIKLRETHSKKLMLNANIFQLPTRLWNHLCFRAGVAENISVGQLSNHILNKLVEELVCCSFAIRGKTTFKEEFVTCGGVLLSEIDISTMESKKVPGLFFAGEVLHIDGETGGFNFQAAWTTAFLAANAIASKSKA